MWPPPYASTEPSVNQSKEKISYYYQNSVGSFHYGEGHPMKPPRLALTHNLVLGYGMHKKMSVICPRMATDDEMKQFHTDDYIEFLKRHNLGVDDCPVFDGLYDFVRLSSGSSIEAARAINSGMSDIGINWSGGLHHAKKFEASGFCYVNDIVLCALELLRFHARVLYVDIDVHHGDGVQEAFVLSNRVMTVSFHRYDGQFFPGTGSLDETGIQQGKYYSLNVPLHESIDDDSYAFIFKSVMKNVMETFQPNAIILQCGADSLAGDRLGCFNLSIKAHGECVAFMKSFRLPLVVLGGGGYTIRNVARCWTYETSVLTGTNLPNELPYSEYWSHFAPDYKLHPNLVNPNLENHNSRAYLESVRRRVADYLKMVEGAPSVQMQEIPPSIARFLKSQNAVADEEEDVYPDSHSANEGRVQHSSEYYEDDEDHDDGLDDLI